MPQNKTPHTPPKNSSFSHPCEPNVVEHKKPSDVSKTEKMSNFSRGSENTLTKVKISAHHLRWIWAINGTTFRAPDKIVRMKNWIKKIYNFKGAVVILNKKTLEIWVKSKPYKNTEKMIYTNWNKVDIIAREFSEYAQIGLIPIGSNHPADIKGAHLVLETKKLNTYLEPQAELKSSEKIGLIFDKSHAQKPELTGEYSVEGGIGADYIFLDFPKEFKLLHAKTDLCVKSLDGFEEYNRNIQLHLKVLNEMSDTMKAIRTYIEILNQKR